MEFTKMHGTGNDFVLVRFPGGVPAGMSALAERVCHRHFGVGADGLVAILPSEAADLRMEIWNADGSRAAMCGNATRCVAKYAYDRGLHVSETLRLETASGVKLISLKVEAGAVSAVRVDLGSPRWRASEIPALLDADAVRDFPVQVDGRIFRVNCVSMGNPHCVVYVDDLSDELVSVWGPKLERHPLFPDRTNVEFVRLLSRTEARVRVWERGCGETMACGTGSAAVCAVSRALGKTGDSLRCLMPGGELLLEWEESGGEGRIYKTGPAAFVFDGVWED